MPLNFLKHGPNSERGPHYGAIGGHWPSQRRFIVEKVGHEWRLEVLRHVPGKGFVFLLSDHKPTLKAAKAACEDIANPKPIDRTASSYTDA